MCLKCSLEIFTTAHMCTESLYMCICAQQGKQGVMGWGKALVSVPGGAAVEQITAVRRAQASWDRIKRLQRAQTQITRDVHQRHNPAVPLVSVSGRTQSLTGRLARKKCTHLWYVHGKTFEMKSRSKHAKKTWKDLTGSVSVKWPLPAVRDSVSNKTLSDVLQ